MNRLDRFFQILARGSSFGAEVRGGVVTFVAMAYIVILNPIILSGAAGVTGNTLDFDQVWAATALTAGVMTILFGLSPVCRSGSRRGLASTPSWRRRSSTRSPGPRPWAWWSSTASSSVLSVTGRAGHLPGRTDGTQAAITVGIGLFIASSALWTPASSAAGQRRRRSGSAPERFHHQRPTIVFVVRLLVTGILVARKVQGGILIGFVAGTVLAAVVEAIRHSSALRATRRLAPVGPVLSGQLFAPPDLGLVGDVSFAPSAGSAGLPPPCWCSRSCSPTSSTPWAP